MVKKKRWGKKFEDKRNWKETNQKYIKRGEFLINPKFLQTWNEEIRQMNAGKIGEPYLYPNSMIEFAGYFHSRGFQYRECEGIFKGISENYKHKFPVISYSQINRRVNSLEIDFETVEKNMVVGTDGTGEKVTNRGEWMRQKHKVRRGWIKVVIIGNKKGRVVDIRVGHEKLDERKASRGMIRKNHKKIKKVDADGLHDCRDTFNVCEEFGIETGIKIREDASTKPLGSPRRKREVIEYQKLGYKKWAKKKEYGMRWKSTEGIFSAKKRIFGETVSATKKRNMYHEVKLKYWFYNKLQEIT